MLAALMTDISAVATYNTMFCESVDIRVLAHYGGEQSLALVTSAPQCHVAAFLQCGDRKSQSRSRSCRATSRRTLGRGLGLYATVD